MQVRVLIFLRKGINALIQTLNENFRLFKIIKLLNFINALIQSLLIFINMHFPFEKYVRIQKHAILHTQAPSTRIYAHIYQIEICKSPLVSQFK